MLTSKELIDAGIKPGELFGKILKTCQTIEEAKKFWEENQPQKKVVQTNKMIHGTIWWWLCKHPCFEKVPSTEFPGQAASNSERRR